MKKKNWIKKYKPVHNPFSADKKNILFETYDKDLDFVRKQDVKHIWTLIDDEDLLIIPGYHFVNRLNYLVTEKKWKDENIAIQY